MITEDWPSRWQTSPTADPHCEHCGRSILVRFGSDKVPALCRSCQDSWDREVTKVFLDV